MADRGWVPEAQLCPCPGVHLSPLQNRHCLLDVAPHAIERLHHVHIYPIVIFIHYKSAKHIKWVPGSSGARPGLAGHGGRWGIGFEQASWVGVPPLPPQPRHVPISHPAGRVNPAQPSPALSVLFGGGHSALSAIRHLVCVSPS